MKGTKNHIIMANISDKVIYSNVLQYASVSGHYASYIIAKISTPEYQTRYKFTRDTKKLDIYNLKTIYRRFQTNTFSNSL